jgi:hypothetical protein
MDFKFNLQQKVKIIPLSCKGIITGIWIGETGVKYYVRYFDKAEVKEVYFYEDELEQ